MDNHEETASRLFLSVEQSRNVDRFAIETLGMNSLILMENAGRGAAAVIYQHVCSARSKEPHADPQVTLLIGPGNNGGDGWVIARHLEAWGIKTACFLFGSEDRLSPDNQANYQVLSRSGFAATKIHAMPPIIATDLLRHHLTNSSIIVDTLLGTGSSGSPREPMGEAIRLANQTNAFRVAIDLPSGLDADSGIPAEPTFRADCTLTMVTQKIGFKNPLAREYLGEVKSIPIGIPASQLRSLLDL